MRKRMFLIITVYFFIVCIFSQSVSETRKIKTTAIEIYEKYTSIIANLHNGDVYNLDKFLSLFDENASIYNDIRLAKKQQKYLSPQEYFDVSTKNKNIEKSHCDYSNLNLQFPDLKNDKWEIKCTFIKSVSNKKKKKFNTVDSVTVTIIMDTTYNQTNKIYNNAKIKSIKYNSDSIPDKKEKDATEKIANNKTIYPDKEQQDSLPSEYYTIFKDDIKLKHCSYDTINNEWKIEITLQQANNNTPTFRVFFTIENNDKSKSAMTNTDLTSTRKGKNKRVSKTEEKSQDKTSIQKNETE
ncbi:MAG: hypothetical protein LBG80_10100 [Bacteroidales bacterium]|jgi:hypothetical protein|nr:hypothetical protein [Bacteroidales bacterium]